MHWFPKVGKDMNKFKQAVGELLHPTVYLVVKGDNLSKIGKKFGVKWLQIAKDNNIKAPYIIGPGQKLIINR